MAANAHDPGTIPVDTVPTRRRLRAGSVVAEPQQSDALVAPYVPFGTVPRRDFHRFQPPPVHTVPVWWLVTSPLWWSAVQVVLFFALGAAFAPLIQLAFGAVILLLVIALAAEDRKQLLDGGHVSAATAWWVLLTPLAYLVARAFHVRSTMGRGIAPPLVFLLLLAIPVTFAVVLPWLRSMGWAFGA